MQRLLLALLFLLSLALPMLARAEPYLALQMGLKCAACHVNPTGGGLRTALGVAFARGSIPANQLPEKITPNWTGGIGDYFRLGADLRTALTRTAVPDAPTQKDNGLEQFRVYADVQVIKDRLGLYLDETVEPGKPQRQEAYVRASMPGLAWYAKAGQFYLPFGWRLQDQSAFVRTTSGINMTTPDKGLELGMERENWSAQLDYTDGIGNSGNGHQVTSQVVWLQPWGRLGASGAMVTSPAGNRQVAALFGGTRTGPLVWLAELDLVSDASYPEGRRKLLATLAEVNWLVRQGHNLKFTAESLDPDRRVSHDEQARYSLVYEYTPIPFVQLRAGMRRYLGIPQSPLENRRFSFLELHGYF